jgi:hypothetical protein
MRTLAGDERISEPVGSPHAITIQCSRQDTLAGLFRWGRAVRAGTAMISSTMAANGVQKKSYRGFRKSSSDLFPALPGTSDGFFVLDYKPEWFLVLGSLRQPGHLFSNQPDRIQTRLIAGLGNPGYSFHKLPLGLVKFIHFVWNESSYWKLRGGRKQKSCVRSKVEVHEASLRVIA